MTLGLFSRLGSFLHTCSFHSCSVLRFPRQSSLPRANVLLVEKLRAQAKERLSIDSAIALEMEDELAPRSFPTPLRDEPSRGREQQQASSQRATDAEKSNVSFDLTRIESIKSFIDSIGGHDTQVITNELHPGQAAVQYMIITESDSSRARQAIAEHFWQVFKNATKDQQAESTRDFFLQQKHTMLQSDWLAYDLGFCFLHIMSPEARQKYNLESLWSGQEAQPVAMDMAESQDPFLESEREIFEFDKK